jgi:hypothetical protein
MSTLDHGNLDNYLVDKSSVLRALSIRQIEMKRAGLLSQRSLMKNKSQSVTHLSSFFLKENISYIFVLAINSNVQYVEQGIERI